MHKEPGTEARNGGFTLVELLVVIVILGILMAVAVPTFLRQQSKAQDSRTQQYLTTAFKAIRSGLPETNQLYLQSTSMVSWITQSEPELAAQSGSCATQVQTAPVDKILVDPASTPTALTLCARSQSGSVWKLTATNTGVQQLLDGTLVPLVMSGNEITDATRAAAAGGDGALPSDGHTNDSSYGVWELTTQLLGRTNDFTSSDWQGYFTKPAFSGGQADPFGGVGAIKISAQVGGNGGNYLGFLQMAGDGVPGNGVGDLPTGTYTSSIWMKSGPGTTQGVQFGLKDSHTVSATVTDQWTRYTFTTTYSGGEVNERYFQVFVSDSQTMPDLYLFAPQTELKGFATPYVPNTAAKDTTTTRNGAYVHTSAGLLNATQGWVAVRFRVGWSAASRSDYPQLFGWQNTGDSTNRISLLWDGGNKKWVMDSRTAASPADAATAVQSHGAGTLITLIGTWSQTTLGISINGGAFSTNSNTKWLTPSGTQFGIGSGGEGGSQADSDILWFACGSGTLSNADATTINSWGSADPKLAAFPAAAQTTMVWDGAGANGSLK